MPIQTPTIADLIKALPQETEADLPAGALASEPAELSRRSIPLGRLRRVGLLATLQSKIAAAYLFYWIRGWFSTAAQRERLLAETHWRTAARLLDSMNYLRGAAMKMGQTLGNLPDIVPSEFAETLAQLHYDAPPMHWALLREMVFSELGDDPENLFASFNQRAFAAASLGQVHRAKLKSGEDVAVKIQYPGIARTITEDFRNLALFMLPGRLSIDWENMREQADDLRLRLERETDYEREARALQKARSLFRDDEGIVIPRVYPELSTGRVLTMQRLEGVHLDQFLAGNPSQEARNEAARKILRAWYRMMFAGRIVYADFNPGNFLFMDDGRLGVIDFGCMVELDDELWDLFRRMDRPLTTGDRAERIAFLEEWSTVSDSPAEQDRLRVMEEFCDWSWRGRYSEGEYDFGDETAFRRGIELFIEMVRKRYTRGHASSPIFSRQQLGFLAMLYRLKAKIALTPIAEEEVRAAGWDRSDYAPR